MWPDRAAAALLIFAAGVLALPAIAADESIIFLADGPGRDKVQAACSMCHSLDYVVMNSPFLDRAGWEKTVNKMVNVYGAPLTTQDVAAITEYLERHYGKAAEKVSSPAP